MVRTAPQVMEGFTKYTEEGVTRGALCLNTTTRFWVAVVSTFWALYELIGTFVYSKDDMVKVTSMNAQHCVTSFGE